MNIKDFDGWAKKKKAIHELSHEIFYAQERNVFLCALGVNIGSEQDGRIDHERPVLIVKKFNSKIVWVIPLTSKQKYLDFYHNFIDPHGQPVAAILAQLRLISTKRLIRKLYVLDEQEFETIKKRVRKFLQ